MTHFIHVESFDDWRSKARQLLSLGVEPAAVSFTTTGDQPGLFESDDHGLQGVASTATVPKQFLELSRAVACHRSPARWEMLYQTLWRLTHGERHLLEITTDDDVHRLHQMQKAVSRDVHKMKAFVRFRKTTDPSGEDNYIAWHRPDHRIVRLAAPFFSRRFKSMNWTIFTPDESVCWDQQQLNYGPGVPASQAPDGDTLEDLWKTYYASVFNPARVKVAAMKREMPTRHWPTLPETEMIPELLRRAPGRVSEMIERNEGFDETAAHYLPAALDLELLREAAETCRGCQLHRWATQTVFGTGPKDARMVIVGEQPGDREDLRGLPFVGPAGQLLDAALARAGIDRQQVYLTNAVKHFKYIQRGKRRLHQKPSSREVYACRPWLEAELSVIRPAAIVCLGSTSAQALMGRDFRISQRRGRVTPTDWCPRTIATWHPAAILRMPNDVRRREMQDELARDLKLASQ